ncbi:MAG: histone deacetylase [Methanobacteriota archaeon]|nr:MAG: histone deacetylase [Euryarchaeota archaeon]
MALFFNEEFCRHVQTSFHPESPERLKGIIQKLKLHGLWSDVVSSTGGCEDRLKLIHDEEYIGLLRDGGNFNLTMDTFVHPETYEIAALSAKCGVDAVEHSKKEESASFALTRPPGHHAGSDYGMGFCYFNNIAIAAEGLLRGGDHRIAIVDPDVHHGNGTEHIFTDRADVLYISTHQMGIFPGTGSVDFLGTGEGEGFTINIPFPSGSGDSTYLAALSRLVVPIVSQFDPDAILVSLGTDGHYRDPLASLSLSSVGYLEYAKGLITLSEGCRKRITFFLEGGYDVPALSEVVASIVGAFKGVETPLEFTDAGDDECVGMAAIERCSRNASKYWRL